ncbi:MAG: hypothetical protein JXN65_09200 [Clostridia bacterium]|nr:hypothetical protein [Clostridia bacterium]
MIKRIIAFTVILMLLTVAIAYANSAPEHMHTDEKILDVVSRIDITDVNIGEEFVFEMTITNLTRYDIEIEYISFYQLGNSNFWDRQFEMVEGADANLVKGFESVVYEFTCEIGEDLYFYKKDDNFFVDVVPYIEFWIDNNYNYRDLYSMGNNPISLKIANLNDGEEFLEYTWLDTRDTFYYHGKEYRYYDENNVEVMPIGSVYYELLITNKSDDIVYTLEPEEGMYIHENHRTMIFPNDEVLDIYNLCHSDIFVHEDKYYAIYAEREYTVDYIEPPTINIEISRIDGDGNDFYEVKVSNAGNEIIENLFITLEDDKYSIQDENLFRIGSLSLDEEWIMKGSHLADDRYFIVKAGYLVDGLVYCWTIWVDKPIEDTLSFSQGDFSMDLYFCDCIDYQYMVEFEEHDVQEAIASETSLQTEQSKVAVTVSETADSATDSSTKVIVKKRYNVYIFLLVFVMLIAISAVVMIKIAIIKKKKTRIFDDNER